MKTRGKVLEQIQGYRVCMVVDNNKPTGFYGVFAGKNPVNNDKGFKTQAEAKELAIKIVNGEEQARVIKKNKR